MRPPATPSRDPTPRRPSSISTELSDAEERLGQQEEGFPRQSKPEIQTEGRSPVHLGNRTPGQCATRRSVIHWCHTRSPEGRRPL